MNKVKFNEVLQVYLEGYDQRNDPKGENWEYAKYEAISWFQQHWNSDAADFADMFNLATKVLGDSKHHFIVSGGKFYQPLKGIQALLKNIREIDLVRDCFLALYNDADSAQSRAEMFRDRINERLANLYPRESSYKQDMRSAVFFLNLKEPAGHYIYFPSRATQFAKQFDFDAVEQGKLFSLDRYYQMCDAVRDEIKGNKVLMEKFRTMLSDKRTGLQRECNDDLHILVYDIIYCMDKYDIYSTYDHRVFQQKVDDIYAKLDALKSKLTEVEGRIKPLPDLTGERVKHSVFGYGTVTSVNGDVMTIRTTTQGEKKLLISQAFAPPLKIENVDYMETMTVNMISESEATALKEQIEQLESSVHKLKKS